MSNHLSQKQVIVVTGPTAVGKSGVAIELAEHYQAKIISADSRQCYKELNIGVARPSIQQLQRIPHHFIASHSIHEEINAAGYEQYALNKVHELFTQADTVIMVGGTGLYIRAFCEGLHGIPAVSTAIRAHIINKYEQNGIGWLQNEIREKDPEFYRSGEIKNPQRMMRALEVKEATGQSILSFRKGDKIARDFRIIRIGLHLPPEILKKNIEDRTDQMMGAGLLEEVKNLYPYRHLNALQTVGYTELFECIDGKISLPQAVTLIKQHSWQYARRQMTWFRKDKATQWFDPAKVKEMIIMLKG